MDPLTDESEKDEPWQQEYEPEAPKDAESSQSQGDYPTLAEPTGALKKFRPIKSRPKDLERILEAKADPNYILQQGDISPLRKVLFFFRPAGSMMQHFSFSCESSIRVATHLGPVLCQ